MTITVTDIDDRLYLAAQTLWKMPKAQVMGHRSSWPEVVRESVESYGYGQMRVKPGPPQAKHITQMDEALRWLLWLDKDEAKLTFLRANRVKWKRIAQRMNWGETKCKYLYKAALVTIAHRLATKPRCTRFPYRGLIGVEVRREMAFGRAVPG